MGQIGLSGHLQSQEGNTMKKLELRSLDIEVESQKGFFPSEQRQLGWDLN